MARSGRHVELGRRGEAIAARYLAGRGFRILQHRFRTRGGEIDLVAEEGETLAFIEVKTRSSAACGRPAEAVDRRKQARLARVQSQSVHRVHEYRRDRKISMDEATGELQTEFSLVDQNGDAGTDVTEVQVMSDYVNNQQQLHRAR